MASAKLRGFSRCFVFATSGAISLASICDPAPAQCQIDELSASDAADGDRFGASVSLEGDLLVIGSPLANGNQLNSGAAYVFEFDGTSWVEQQKLVASDGDGGDQFGGDLSLSGNAILIGARYAGPNDDESGAAYVFRFDGSSWREEQILRASDPEADDIFGTSVSIDGNVALVGAPYKTQYMHWVGAVYYFRYDGAMWVEEQKFLASDYFYQDHFGVAVDMDGQTAVIGADGAIATYVFRLEGDEWVQQQKLVPSDGEIWDFGESVSLAGDVLAIGASSDHTMGSHAGAAYVYRFNGTTWLEEQKLLASDGAAYDYLGHALAIGENVLIVGATADDVFGLQSGSSYLYRYDGSQWYEEQKVLPEDGKPEDRFGYGVDIDGDVAVIGATWDSDATYHAGSAYVFAGISGLCAEDVNCDEIVDVLDLLAVLSAWGDSDPAADINGDGTVDVVDLLALLGAWGPCA